MSYCPECGGPVARAVRADRLIFPSSTLRTVRLVLAAFLVLHLLWVCAWFEPVHLHSHFLADFRLEYVAIKSQQALLAVLLVLCRRIEQRACLRWAYAACAVIGIFNALHGFFNILLFRLPMLRAYDVVVLYCAPPCWIAGTLAAARLMSGERGLRYRLAAISFWCLAFSVAALSLLLPFPATWQWTPVQWYGRLELASVVPAIASALGIMALAPRAPRPELLTSG